MTIIHLFHKPSIHFNNLNTLLTLLTWIYEYDSSFKVYCWLILFYSDFFELNLLHSSNYMYLHPGVRSLVTFIKYFSCTILWNRCSHQNGYNLWGKKFFSLFTFLTYHNRNLLSVKIIFSSAHYNFYLFLMSLKTFTTLRPSWKASSLFTGFYSSSYFNFFFQMKNFLIFSYQDTSILTTFQAFWSTWL